MPPGIEIFSCMYAYVRSLRSDPYVFRYVGAPYYGPPNKKKGPDIGIKVNKILFCTRFISFGNHIDNNNYNTNN